MQYAPSFTYTSAKVWFVPESVKGNCCKVHDGLFLQHFGMLHEGHSKVRRLTHLITSFGHFST